MWLNKVLNRNCVREYSCDSIYFEFNNKLKQSKAKVLQWSWKAISAFQRAVHGPAASTSPGSLVPPLLPTKIMLQHST